MALEDNKITKPKISLPESKRTSDLHTLTVHHVDTSHWRHSHCNVKDPKLRSSKPNQLAVLLFEWWTIELASWALGAFCVVVIIFVLWHFDGRALPDLGFGLTINGFISIFSGIAQAALLFPTAEALGQLKWTWFRSEPKPLLDFDVLDSASRGPWGCVTLLGQSILSCNSKAKRMRLACLGAAVIIMALPFQLFVQQLVQTPTVWYATNSSAKLTRTIQYSTFKPLSTDDGENVISPDVALQNTVVPFFYGSGKVPDVDCFCPTSDCKWSTFQTLGVCSACKELPSQYLSWGCYDGPADWLNDVTLSLSTKFADYPNRTSCGYFLNVTSSAPVLMTGYARVENTSNPTETLTMRLFPLVDGLTRQPYYGGSIMFKNVTNAISDFLIVATAEGAEGVYQNATPVAQECVLNWCVQTMSSNFSRGHFQEVVIDSWQNTTVEPFPWNVTFNETTGVPLNFQYTRDIVLTPPSSEITFGLNADTMVETSFTMDIVLPSFLTAANSTAIPRYKFNNQNMSPRSIPMTINPWLSAGSIPDYLTTIAKAMTITIRNSANSSNMVETFSGDALQSKVLIHVLWPWITLPASVLACSLVFLLTTIYTSDRAAEVGVWKTSALAILFNGLHEELTKDEPEQVWTLRDLKQRASNMKVKLGPD
ncbi:uncharacterized protein PV09_03700 [Verruconis gallopava]|uniref:Uncharacterized protein n=1 Tax=Verruconis gallopava TaxID=253628 RepID=A0A0D2B1E5_9PEZI|nr:uncharacterized protein PV09_03700 [Verruconis gallopava]KIW05149.1 hypothetical protein PV09_03700 [Verruconis gallopava]